MKTGKRVRIIKKIREQSGVWRFVYLQRNGNRYVWDDRPGTYFLEWWQDGGKRRQTAGQTVSEAIEARRRKRNELIGELVSGGKEVVVEEQGPGTTIAEAKAMFLDHVRVHSPDKPKTFQRYRKVLEHFEWVLGKRRFVEAVSRADIDDYKTSRSKQKVQWPLGSERLITPRTINFEVSVLRTFFYFLINERGLKMENPALASRPLRTRNRNPSADPRPTHKRNSTSCLRPAANSRKRFSPPCF